MSNESQDKEDDEVASCADPYSTSPTLLDLQHMRNRLNVAQAGKELMQWNSTNTGEELRKISEDLQNIYKNFGRDMREAFLLLTRCKYYNEDFYKTITENVKQANVQVQCKCSNVAGVTIINFTAIDVPNTKTCKCPFICRGGQAIQEAKKAWADLLKTHIKMAELRTNFLALEAAYRTATKRHNVISQIVLPKTKATINYILVELEEISRDEFHRIKLKSDKINNTKLGTKESSNTLCSCTDDVFCMLHNRDHGDNRVVFTRNGKVTSVSCVSLPTQNIYDVSSKMMKRRRDQPTPPLKDMVCVSVGVREPHSTTNNRIDTLMSFYELVSLKKDPNFFKSLSLGDFNPKFDKKTIENVTNKLNELLTECQDIRNRLKIFNNSEKPCQSDSLLTAHMKHLKYQIDAIVEAKSKLQNSVLLSQSVRKFIKSCEAVDDGLKRAVKDMASMPLNDASKKRITHLINHIDDVVKIITDYREEGLLTPSLEEFSKICNETKVKLSGYTVQHDLYKIEFLQGYVSDLEKITTNIKKDGVKIPSIENFLSSCRGFKAKLEEHKQRKKRLSSERKAKKASRREQADNKDVAETNSVQKFMKSCEDMIRQFKSHDNSTTKIFGSLYHMNVMRIAKLMATLQVQGLLSRSTVEFLAGNDRNKRKMDSNCRDLTTSSLQTSDRSSFNISTQSRTICEENLPDDDKHNNAETFVVTEALKSASDRSTEKLSRFSYNMNRKIVNVDTFGNTISTFSSQQQSDIIVEEISTYNSCPELSPRESNTWQSQSSDSSTKPLLPKMFCMRCMSEISSDTSTDRLICDGCRLKHAREDAVKAMPNVYTV